MHWADLRILKIQQMACPDSRLFRLLRTVDTKWSSDHFGQSCNVGGIVAKKAMKQNNICHPLQWNYTTPRFRVMWILIWMKIMADWPFCVVLNQQLSLPDAATPLIMLGVSKNEHSLCEIFPCQESVFNTFTKSELRLSGALVWYWQAGDDVRITTLEGFKFSNN